MKTSAPTRAPKTNRISVVSDLAPKTGLDVRGGTLRRASAPAVSEIVVTKDQDCSSTSL